MDAYRVWLRVCDWIAAYLTEGCMTDDFPDYDWRAAYDWGDDPMRAVRGAIGVYKPLSVAYDGTTDMTTNGRRT